MRDKEQFANLLEKFKLCSKNSSSNIDTGSLNGSNYGRNIQMDRLIVMDNFSGLAETSQKFASFLTVAIKFKYNCVQICYTIHPEKSIWKSILS